MYTKYLQFQDAVAVLDCRIAANFIPYGPANTDQARNKILRLNDLPARQAHGGRAAFGGASRRVHTGGPATTTGREARGMNPATSRTH